MNRRKERWRKAQKVSGQTVIAQIYCSSLQTAEKTHTSTFNNCLYSRQREALYGNLHIFSCFYKIKHGSWSKSIQRKIKLCWRPSPLPAEGCGTPSSECQLSEQTEWLTLWVSTTRLAYFTRLCLCEWLTRWGGAPRSVSCSSGPCWPGFEGRCAGWTEPVCTAHRLPTSTQKHKPKQESAATH